MMNIIPDDRSDTEVLWFWERMIEKTEEIWRRDEKVTYMEVAWHNDHPHDLFYSYLGNFVGLVWVE